MRAIPAILMILTLVTPWAVCAADDDKYAVNPTADPLADGGIYIPKSLGDAFVELDRMLTPALIAEIKAGTEDDMINYHFGLGMWMRNHWGLWSGSRLAAYFGELGIHHPDDMSSIVLDSYWRYLNGRSIELEQQIQVYKTYWEDLKKQQQGDQ
jgi:hypothetical protein